MSADALDRAPESNGGSGSYSIINWLASAASRPTSNSTSRNAMSMPLDTPAAVMMPRRLGAPPACGGMLDHPLRDVRRAQ